MADIIVKGTTFSSDAVAGDVLERTDIIGWYQYDGTRWLTTQRIPFVRNIEAVSATSIQRTRIPSGGYNIAIDGQIACTSFVATTNDGSNYWTVLVAATSTTFGSDVNLLTFTTAADTANTYTVHDASPITALPAVGAGVDITVTKTGSPGAVYVWTAFGYRLIAT